MKDIILHRTAIADFIRSLPSLEGIYRLSEKSYAFDEASYDEHYGYNDGSITQLSESFQKWALQLGLNTQGDFLEIGSGTGVLSLAAFRAGLFTTLVVSDPSPQFLKLSLQKFAHEPRTGARTFFVSLSGEDIVSIPSSSLDVVCLRYTLHHILNWRSFFTQCFRVLKNGGALIFEEPFAEGFLLQAVLIHFYHAIKENSVTVPGERDQQWYVNYLKNSVEFYMCNSVDKQDKEDKHLFMAHEIMTEAQKIGFVFEFFPNVGFDSFTNQSLKKDKFINTFLHNCRVNLQFPNDMAANISETFRPVSDYIEKIAQERDCSFSRGIFVLKK